MLCCVSQRAVVTGCKPPCQTRSRSSPVSRCAEKSPGCVSVPVPAYVTGVECAVTSANLGGTTESLTSS